VERNLPVPLAILADVYQTAVKIQSSAGGQRTDGIPVEVVQLIVGFGPWEEEIVAQPQVQSQFARYLPVILKVTGYNRPTDILVWTVTEASASRAQHVGSKTVACGGRGQLRIRSLRIVGSERKLRRIRGIVQRLNLAHIGAGF